MRTSLTLGRWLLCALLAASAAGCRKDKDTNDANPVPGIDGTRARPAWGPSMTDSMLVAIEQLSAYSAPPIEGLTPAEARKQPTLTDAVNDVVRKHGIPVPPPQVDTSGIDIPVAGGTILARVYKPKAGAAPFPVVVYYQGGGYVIANLDVYDPAARGLSEQTGAIVVSVQYRKGPEYKFPTAHNDAFAAYKWVAQNAASIGGNPARIAVAGESAGGNLACNVSIMARDSGITMPRYQVLVYPVANNDLNAPSVLQYRDAKPLNRGMLMWFLYHYLNSMSESADPRIKLVAANLAGLPPTMIINAEIDPLRDDGQALQQALQVAGVTVTRRLYSGATHEFFGAAILIPEAKDAQALASAALRAALQ